MSGAGDPPRRRAALLGAALVLLTVVAYAPVVRCGFVWDDEWWVSGNPTLEGLDGLRAIWLDPTSHQQYYPLVPTSFWLERPLWGAEPLGYHLVNVALHAAAALLLWTALRRLAVPAPWLVAALFAVHPVHVESVAWITERKNVLSTALYLAAALPLLRFLDLDSRDHGERRRRPAWRLYLAGSVGFVAALLAKTTAATLPAALLLLVWWKRGRVGLREAALMAPLLAVGAAFGSWTAWLEKHHVGAEGQIATLAPLEHVVLAGRAVWFYAGKIVWPHPLVFVYPRWTVSAADPRQLLAAAAAVAAVAALWAARRRVGRGPLAGALFFGGTLVPALGFFDVFYMRYSFVADHFQYLASVGWIALLVATGVTAARRAGAVGALAAKPLAALVLASLVVLTWRQVGAYRSEEALWRDTLAKNPDAWLAHTNLGLILARSGRAESAIEHYRAAIRLDPPVAEPRLNLGELLQRLGRGGEAIAVIREAVRVRPDDPIARYNLGTALGKGGRYDEAAAELREALARRPDFPEARRNLATALALQGRLDEATREYRDAIARRPDDWNARAGLADALERSGRAAEGGAERTEGLRWRAWTLATHRDPARRDGREAVRIVERIGGEADTAPLLDTLGAAYAEAGRFGEATAAAERALALARSSGRSELVAAIEARLARYRRGKAYRDPSTRLTPLSRPGGWRPE